MLFTNNHRDLYNIRGTNLAQLSLRVERYMVWHFVIKRKAPALTFDASKEWHES